MIKFEMSKNILLEGLCYFKTYDSIGYSCGETTVFLYNDYVYLYNDECDSYKYNKPYSQCTSRELEKFVNSTIDSGGEFAWDDFISKEEWNKDFEKGEHWTSYDEHIEELVNNDYENFEPFIVKPRKKTSIFKMQDDFAEWNDDCTFYLKTNCDKETLEEIVAQASFIVRDEEEDIKEGYKKFYEECQDWSKIEIIEKIVKTKGYTWQQVDFEVVEW